MSGDKIVITKDDLGAIPPSGRGFGGAPPISSGAAAPQGRGGWVSNAIILLVVAAALGGLIAAAVSVAAAERACPAPQAVTAPTGPAAWCLVIDRSVSMAGDKLTDAKDAAKDFVGGLKPDDQVCVIDFGDNINVTVDLQRAGGSATISDDIDGIQYNGNTALWDAGMTGVSKLSTADPAKARIMILLTDGGNNASRYSVDDLIDSAKKNKVVIHTVALGPDADRSVLKHVAEETKGVWNYAQSSKQLRGIYRGLGGKKP